MRALALLLASGADPDARGEDGMNALAISAKSCNRAECQALLGAGADPNALDVSGMSPLHHLYSSKAKAAASRQEAVGGMFAADPRVDWSLRDKRGRIPLELACSTALPDAHLIALAKLAPAKAVSASTASGSSLMAALAARGGSFLARVEADLLEGHAGAAPDKKAKAKRSL